ncbi:uncharacterized protein HMPREF1120_08852 [Exophiala dermatitidis NIH/UT8656]|uniref:Uncharacterized protein n=1 Tax=Exophiala dermatitidis (strain ATCC 34100 / CBS 525.76 / NIH/UT8656) TaxID=858893 RepID=H6CAW1_EXODN|nr:uncharacterized protein HMPREF1120_08852 [Exophiala dermatitidis NIH/UT8656]EHY60908.1 hypothetical protein HMPREF1120_08852 [Exophiala dermatitidis NIH/UT8656]
MVRVLFLDCTAVQMVGVLSRAWSAVDLAVGDGGGISADASGGHWPVDIHKAKRVVSIVSYDTVGRQQLIQDLVQGFHLRFSNSTACSGLAKEDGLDVTHRVVYML